MLTTRRLALMRNKIEGQVSKLANPATHIAEMNKEGINDQREMAALRLFFAAELKRRAAMLLEVATTEAIQHGVLYDKKSHSKDPGNYTLFEGDHCYVTATVKNGATRVDKAALRTALMKAKVPTHIIDAAFTEAEKRDANSHTFTSWIRVADEPVNPQQPTPVEAGK